MQQIQSLDINILTSKIDKILKEKNHIIIGIDGYCGSGKTTLSNALADKYNASIIRVDHFFLTPEQRTKKRLETAGENIDHERLLSDVLIPLKDKKDFSYKPFDCSKGALGTPVFIKNKSVNIVEGSYSMHKNLLPFYDLKVFLSVDYDKQLKRLKLRDENKLQMFIDLWIPLEQKYFNECKIAQKADIIFNS